MERDATHRQIPLRPERYGWAVMGLWTAFAVAVVGWMAYQQKQSTVETALQHTRAAFDRDLVYRRWVSDHGGVYVPVAGEMVPNPHLAHLPERDIETLSGRRLTLVNPAYMTRKIHELGMEQWGLLGHITSAAPINTLNAPDSWEAAALRSFEHGATEAASVETIRGEEHMRFMRPLFVESSCLHCHAVHGYKEGDIRGGISVSLPMRPLTVIAERQFAVAGLGLGFLWLTGLFGIGLGAAGLKRRAAELVIAKEKAESADRLKSAFLATMSHEVRTPLQCIIGFASILLKRMVGPLNQEQEKQINLMLESSYHLLDLINDVLHVAKIESGQLEIYLEAVDMRSTIDGVVQRMTPLAARKDLPIVVTVTPAVGEVTGDRCRVDQILTNLISNAIKFTDRGEVRVESAVVDDRVVTSVIDTGIGIRQDDIDKLFKTFQRLDTETSRWREGTGLGLSICKQLVELQGGTIHVESEAGVGSVLSFTLPSRTQ